MAAPSPTMKTWRRESVTAVKKDAPALVGFGTAVRLDGIETVISAPTMAGLEKVYEEILRLDDDGTMSQFDKSKCTPIVYIPQDKVELGLDL